jgi:hypothetical protein
MMPVVRVSDAAFADLRVISDWLGTETPAKTIDAIVNRTMDSLGLVTESEVDETESETAPAENAAVEFKNTPALTFTKPLAATVDGKKVQSPRWSSILATVIAALKAQGFEGEKLVGALHVPAKLGYHDDEGFKFYANLGISIQGQSASDAWREIERIAKKWKIPVEIEFWWRHNPKAQHPGKTGIIRAG